MTRIPLAVAATLAALTACAQDIRSVPDDVERAVANLAIDTLAADLKVPREESQPVTINTHTTTFVVLP